MSRTGNKSHKAEKSYHSRASETHERRLLITVHGIRTFGDWQERLEKMVRDETGNVPIQVLNYKYGYFSIAAFIIPLFRWLVVRRFRTELVSWCSREKWSQIDLVGHSFGTHVLAWALHGIPENERPKINTIILAGSVLRGSFPWRDLVGSCVDRVVNDCGSKDNVLVVNQLFVLFTGMAGRAGFSGTTHGHFRNRFFAFGHSGYFVCERGKPDNKWMGQYWLPVLRGKGAIAPYDERPLPSAIDGIVQTLANNAEPIKLTMYVTPVVLAGLWIWGLYQEADAQRAVADAQRAVAEAQRTEAIEQRDAAQESQSRHLAEKAKQEFSKGGGDYGTALLLALASLPDNSKGPDGLTLVRRPFVTDSQDVLYTAYNNMREIAVSGDPELEILDFTIASGELLAVITTSGQPARVWNATTGRHIAQLEGFESYNIRRAVISPDGARVAAVSNRGLVRVWDAETGSAGARLEGDYFDSGFIAFSPDGTQLLVRSATGFASLLWNVETGKSILEFEGTLWGTKSVGFSPDGARVGAVDGTELYVWSADTGKIVHKFEIPYSGFTFANFTSVAFSPDGTRIVTGLENGTAHLWDANTGNAKAILTLEATDRAITSVAFSRDAVRVATASDDGIVRIWDAATGEAIIKLVGHSEPVSKISFSPDGRRIATSSTDGTVRLWDATTRDAYHNFTWSDEKPTPVVESEVDARSILSPDGSRIIALDFDAFSARLTDARTDKILGDFEKAEGPMGAVFSADSNRIVTTLLTEGTVRLWDAATGKPIATLVDIEGQDSVITLFSTDSKWIVTASSLYNLASIWDAATGKLIVKLEGHSDSILDVIFSFDNTQIATISRDMTARIWDAATGRTIVKLDGLGREFASAAFSPDGSRVMTISPNNTARVWDAANGQMVSTVELGQAALTRAAFGPSGDRVVFAFDDKTTLVWRLFQTTEALVARAKRTVGRCLTQTQLQQFHLQADPPRWCITGVGNEAVTDASKWQPKWPYQSNHWKNWLAAQDARNYSP